MRIAFVGDSLTSGMPGCSYVDRMRKYLVGHTVLNLGRGNDTVLSLHHRMQRWKPIQPVDVAVLWVGVNDLSGEGTGLMRWINRVRGQPRAKGRAAFRETYSQALDLLCERADSVIALSLALRGEDLDNEWNRLGDRLSQEIRDLVLDRDQVVFLDLRPALVRAVDGKAISTYAPRPWGLVVLDALVLHGDAAVDRAARRRGLHLTLDGVHLGSAGADLVAGEVLAALRNLFPDLCCNSGAASE
jgi:lysophospholipase L1-like esterase